MTRHLLSVIALCAIGSACATAPLPANEDDDDGSGIDAGGAGSVAASAGSGADAGTTSNGTSSSAASGGGQGCDGVFGGSCGICLEAACCAQVSACVATPGCMDCVTGIADVSCSEEPAPYNLVDCALTHCEAECLDEGGGGGGGHDLVTCTGPASTSGSIYGVTPAPTIGYVWPDPSGNIAVALYPGSLSTSPGDIVVGVYFFVAPNQMSYPPNGTVGCAVLEDNGSSFSAVDTTQLCEVHLSTLQMASSPGVCDGVLEGTFQGIFSGNQPLAGAFSVPVSVAWSQTSGGPSCQPPNGPCSTHSDCCSQSCSIYIGVCN